MTELTPELRDKFRRVKMLAMDVDGVLTDGGVYVFEDGREFRRFDIKDGLGIKRLVDAGIVVAVISSSSCQAVVHRLKKLGVTEIHLGVEDKAACLKEICARYQIELADVAYIGDDLADLAVIKEVGLACGPADAAEEMRGFLNIITIAYGGRGAVRRVCDLIWGTQGES